MSDWPIDHSDIPNPGRDHAIMGGRVVNMILPISVPGRHQVRIHMSMPETDARALVNMSDELAHEMGPVFELIRSSIRNFIEEEG
jgi:hypothetical protein